MISSARQGAARSVSYGLGRPSWSLALHAESSAQALLRAQAPPPPPRSLARPISREAHSRARFSAAAVAVQDHPGVSDYDDVDDTSWYPPATARKKPFVAATKPPRAQAAFPPPPERAPPRPEIPLVKFRRLITNDPLSSLLTLPSLPPDQLWSIALVEFDVLLSSLDTSLRRGSLPPTLEYDDIHSALVQLRGAISNHPQAAAPSARMLGKRHRLLLQVCLMLDDRDLAQDIWREAVENQDGAIKGVDRFISVIADSMREWKTILWMLDPSLFPSTSLTPIILDRYIQAHLATQRPEEVLALFHRHARLGLTPTPDSYNHLLQAMLELGNMAGARAAAARGRSEAGLSKYDQQMAILRGHRTLGAKADLEEKVLGDLKKLGEEPQEGLINALIRLRVNDQDWQGADRLLARYGLDRGASQASLQPTADSVFLALKVAGRARDISRVRRLWTRLCDTPKEITDPHLAQLISALGYDEGSTYIEDLLDPSHAVEPTLPLPPFRPGIRTLNALLATIPRRNVDLSAIRSSLSLFARLDIPPNAETVRTILHVLSSTLSPEKLASLLRSLLAKYPELQPTLSQVNVILAASLRPGLGRLPTAALDPSSPTAGLISADPLHYCLVPILADLRARQIPSDSASLAIRLRYDALTHATAGGFPSADAVWTNILERGYRPNKRHVLALMSGYADSGAMVEAQNLIGMAKEVDIEPTNGMWMVLLTGWARAGDLLKARSAYQKIEQSADGADIVAVCAMIQAYIRAARYEQAGGMVNQVLLRRFGDQLDKQALTVAVRALQANYEQLAALELVAKYRNDEAVLSAGARRLVRELRNWYRKQERRDDVHVDRREVQRALELSEWILEGTQLKQAPGLRSVRRGILDVVGLPSRRKNNS